MNLVWLTTLWHQTQTLKSQPAWMNMMVLSKEELFVKSGSVSLQVEPFANSHFQHQDGGMTSAHSLEAPQLGAAPKWTARVCMFLEKSKTALYPAAALSVLWDSGLISALVCRSLQPTKVMLSILLMRRRRDAWPRERVSINLEAPNLWSSLNTVLHLFSKVAIHQQSFLLPTPKRRR